MPIAKEEKLIVFKSPNLLNSMLPYKNQNGGSSETNAMLGKRQ